ncbi:MAG: hypothetical protein IKB16_13380 [Lentisphaeria bacterium]|nr:hypothetical protein [Lentisphaeria bacterium]
MEAMTFPGNHRINEYVIPYRNAISANASLGRCNSNALSQGYASLTLGCLTLAALSGLAFREIQTHLDVESFLM